MRGAVVFQRISHGMDHRGIGQHAQLDRANIEVIETGVDLSLQEIQRRHMHRCDTSGVLRSQCGDGGQSVHAMRGKGLQVGLDAGATTGIGAGDGQGGNNTLVGHGDIVQ